MKQQLTVRPGAPLFILGKTPRAAAKMGTATGLAVHSRRSQQQQPPATPSHHQHKTGSAQQPEQLRNSGAAVSTAASPPLAYAWARTINQARALDNGKAVPYCGAESANSGLRVRASGS